nr:TOBE domain-containing protein [Bacteroidota bacterium]
TRDGIEIKINISVPIVALITNESYKQMNIEIGKDIWLYFKTAGVKVII